MQEKNHFIRIGDFFFKYRNMVFPLLWVVLFVSFAPAEGFATPRVIIACLLAALGLTVRGAVIGYAYIKRGGLNKQVFADELVTEGFFNTCRNPLYVGNMLIYAGVFIMHGNPAVMVLGILGSWFIYESIIAAEEYFLRGKFGESYVAYCKEVPRWRMNLSRLGSATQGMQFNFKRVLMKDYSTIANTLVTFVFLNGLRHYHYDNAEVLKSHVLENAVAIIIIMLFALTISRAKKMKLLCL